MDNPVTHRELETFRQLMESENERLKEENNRQNHRIVILEDSIREISSLAASTEKLAANMENNPISVSSVSSRCRRLAAFSNLP